MAWAGLGWRLVCPFGLMRLADWLRLLKADFNNTDDDGDDGDDGGGDNAAAFAFAGADFQLAAERPRRMSLV